MNSHAARMLLGAVALNCSQDSAAALEANLQSHPPLRGGGATRSRRRGVNRRPGEE